MRKNIKFLALFGVAVGLMAGGMMSNEVGTNASAQEVSAATINMSAAKKAGYTKSRVLKANQGRMSGSDKNKLIKGSMAGMKQNKWMDTDPSVGMTKLNSATLLWALLIQPVDKWVKKLGPTRRVL